MEGERDVLPGKDGDFKVERHTCDGWDGFGCGILTAKGGGFEDPAVFVGEHGFVYHCAFVPGLPVEGYHLDAAAPEHGGVRVRGVDPSPGRIGSHEKFSIVGEHFSLLCGV